MSERVRYVAEYDYPGALFPESVTREVETPTWEAVVGAAPAETSGYFRADGWYAVKVTAITEKLFTAKDHEMTWIRQSAEKVRSWVVGEKIHADDIVPTERNAILISNIRGNTPEGSEPYGVHTRAGNWQIASDYDGVVPAHAAVTS